VVMSPFHTGVTGQDAEIQFLGSAIIKPSCIDEETLSPDDFDLPGHGDLWSMLTKMRGDGATIDPLVVAARVGSLGLPRMNREYVATLVAAVVTTSLTHAHADEIRAAAARRRVVGIGQSLLAASSEHQDADELIEQAQVLLDKAAKARRPVSLASLDDGVEEGIQRMSDPAVQTDTPWLDLTKMIGGWRPGRVYVIGARPGSGKTIVGVQAALQMAHIHGKEVAISSLEMDKAELGLRAISMMGRINFQNVQSGALEQYQWDTVAEVQARIAEGKRLFIDDRASVRAADVRAHAREVARRGNLGMVVVDYLQLMEGSSNGENRQQDVSSFSRAMKGMARDLQVPVLLLSQLNRGPDSRGEGGPRLSDLRESGAIEQDCDVALLLHRDAKGAPDDLSVNVAKNRQGPTGAFVLRWQGQYMRVMNA